MVKSIECYKTDIPIGSYITDDLFTSDGALLIKKDTEVTDRILTLLKCYHGKIKIHIKINEDTVIKCDDTEEQDTVIKCDDTEEQDRIFKIADSIKQRTLKSVELMYRGDSKEVISSSAMSIADTILQSLDYNKSVIISVDALKISDEYTFRHCVDVGAISVIIALKLNESPEFLRDIALAGVLHDLGKSKIPIEILNKPTKLDAEEWKIMKMHPVYGYRMIEHIDGISTEIKKAVIEHHENIDGTGYPLGISGDKICKMAKILTVADVYDALVTDRPYKDAKSPADALEIMMGMYNKFDIDILKAFINCVVLYPIGTTIKLSNNEICVVIKNNAGYPLRPICQNVETGEIYDLLNDKKCLSLVIV